MWGITKTATGEFTNLKKAMTLPGATVRCAGSRLLLLLSEPW